MNAAAIPGHEQVRLLAYGARTAMLMYLATRWRLWGWLAMGMMLTVLASTFIHTHLAMALARR